MYLPAHDLTEPIQDFIKMGPSIRVIIPALRHKGLELRLTSVLFDHGPEWRIFMCHYTSDDFCPKNAGRVLNSSSFINFSIRPGFFKLSPISETAFGLALGKLEMRSTLYISNQNEG